MDRQLVYRRATQKATVPPYIYIYSIYIYIYIASMSGVHAGYLKGSIRHISSFLKRQKANSRKTLWKVSPQILPVWNEGWYYFG